MSSAQADLLRFRLSAGSVFGESWSFWLVNIEQIG
jgi:hypothetical protein